MADVSKGKFDWIPLTPAKSVPVRYEFNSKLIVCEFGDNVPKFNSKLMVCEIGDNIQKFDPRFMVSENPISSRRNGKTKESDKRAPEETIEAEAPLFSETPQRINLRKRPTTKMPSTPNSSKCPKLEINNVTETSIQPSKDKDVDREEVVDSNENNCRRKLDVENHAVKRILNVCDEIGGNQSELQTSVGRFNRVYTRIFKPNECLKNSRKIGPNFPSILKKARMGRRRATAYEKFIPLIKLVRRNTPKRKRPTQDHSVTRSRFDKLILKSNWTERRKRSNRVRKMDISFLSSFIKDMRDLQFSEIFLWIASSIRTKLAARAEVSVVSCDDHIQHSGEKTSKDFEDHTNGIEWELAVNVVSCDDHIQHLGEKKAQTSPKDFEDHTDGSEEPPINVVSWDDHIQHLGEKKAQTSPKDFEDHTDGSEEPPINVVSWDDHIQYSGEKKLIHLQTSPKDFDDHTNRIDDEEENDERGNAYNIYTRALVDFSSRMMEGLHIDVDNVSNQLVLQKNDLVIDLKASTPHKHQSLVKVENAKHQPSVKVDNATKYQLARKKKSDTPKQRQPRPKFDKAKYYEVQLDKCISAMHVIQDKQFLPWQGSIVDLVVCGFLIQNFSDCLPSVAFTNLVSRFPAGSDVTIDSASNDIKLLKTVEELCDEVDPEQLSIVEKKYDLKDGNINLLQSESIAVGEIEYKQDTRNWDELRVKYSTPENRTDCNRNSIDWDAVRQTSYHTLTVVILKKSTNYLLAGIIKDLLERIIRDHGTINLEWLRDVPPHISKEYMSSISGLDLKSVEFLSLALSLQHQA